jgi:hypothetical protein
VNGWKKNAPAAAEGRVKENFSILCLLSYPEDGGCKLKRDGVRYQITVSAVITSDVTKDLMSFHKDCVLYFHFMQ